MTHSSQSFLPAWNPEGLADKPQLMSTIYPVIYYCQWSVNGLTCLYSSDIIHCMRLSTIHLPKPIEAFLPVEALCRISTPVYCNPGPVLWDLNASLLQPKRDSGDANDHRQVSRGLPNTSGSVYFQTYRIDDHSPVCATKCLLPVSLYWGNVFISV